MIIKGTWVEVEEIVLNKEERSSNLPEDTKKTPLMVWIRGFCIENCEIGQVVGVKTLAGRILSGKVVEIKPNYKHGFGDYIEEISHIGQQARDILFG